jgi:GTPase
VGKKMKKQERDGGNKLIPKQNIRHSPSGNFLIYLDDPYGVEQMKIQRLRTMELIEKKNKEQEGKKTFPSIHLRKNRNREMKTQFRKRGKSKKGHSLN